ncbi:MAG: trypsin-like peptidase domain-containing protein [Candidatus Saccharimonadales bacterium]
MSSKQIGSSSIDMPGAPPGAQHAPIGEKRQTVGKWLRDITVGAIVLSAAGCSSSPSVGAESLATQGSQTQAAAPRTPGSGTTQGTPGVETAHGSLSITRQERFAELPKETLDELERVFGGLDKIKKGTELKDPAELPGVGIETTPAEREALKRARVDIVRRSPTGSWEVVCNGLLTSDGIVVTAAHCLGIQPGEPMGRATFGMAAHDITKQLGSFPVAVRRESQIIPVGNAYAAKQDGLSTDVAVLTLDGKDLPLAAIGYPYQKRLKNPPVPGSSVYIMSTNGSSPDSVEATGQYLGKAEAYMGGGYLDFVGFKTKVGSPDPCMPGASGAAAVASGSVFGPSSIRLSFEGENVTNEVVQRTIFEKNTGVNTAGFDVLCAYAAADSPGAAYDLLLGAAASR